LRHCEEQRSQLVGLRSEQHRHRRHSRVDEPKWRPPLPSAIPKTSVSLIGLCITLDVRIGVDEQQQQDRRFDETRKRKSISTIIWERSRPHLFSFITRELNDV